MDVRAISDNLTPEMVLEQYPRGRFPMANPGWGVVSWHCPEYRAVIPLDAFHISRSLSHTLKKMNFTVTFDQAFDPVMEACADRGDPEETWINEEFRAVYGRLHRDGKAHSVEVWVDGALAGGVYGLHLGGAFFAESKFHRVRDMSKVALTHLVWRLRSRGFRLLEVQYLTPHLAQFGTIEVHHREYMRLLRNALAVSCDF
ncbi:MAG: leucyl/phenylalanyl-tRNA--protein transferase [Acidobacteria bacterium]|nr:leucyl/phenylalanyl-tRNA--protein transferase [Acidobacteriota bacterium]